MIGGFFNPILQGGTAASMDVDFVASTQSTEPLTTINFTEQTNPSAEKFYWEFGDGSFSTASNPSKSYTGLGTYSISLMAANFNAGKIENKDSFIEITGSPFVQAIGGSSSVITINSLNYTLHRFTQNDTFSILSPGDNQIIDVIIIGGGGSGGGGGFNVVYDAGGGGAQVIVATFSSSFFSLGLSYSVVVGSGGVKSGSSQGSGASSSVFGLTASGGIGNTTVGSGGNSGNGLYFGGARNGFASGGGAGETQNGFNGGTSGNACRGGDGVDLSSFVGTSFADSGWFAGGASGYNSGRFFTPARGGVGHYIFKSGNAENAQAVAALPNSGSGGAPWAFNETNTNIASLQNGGSGVVFIRYRSQ
jgi:PKD repeat protein